MYRRVLVVACAFTSLGLLMPDDAGDRDLRKTFGNTDASYTSVGSIGLTVTNYGTIGTRNAYWPNQPSCEYPRGSRIEHIYQGALWVGAVSRRAGDQRVSTGASDRASTTQGYEFNSEFASTMLQRSTLSQSQYFSESAVSHQDFVGWYADRHRRNPTTGDTILNHVPLGINVRQESYAWDYPFADFFVILNYTIYNTGVDTLDSVYVGLWDNAVVRNTNNVRPGTPGYFEHGGNGFMDTVRMKYTFDYDGIPTPPPANSYVGIKLLGAMPLPNRVDSLGDLRFRTFYNAWVFRASSGYDQNYWSPDDDAENILGARSRYDRLTASLPPDMIAQLRTKAFNVTTLLSTGPFRSLVPGDSLNVAFGVICAPKYGFAAAKDDTREQRKTLYSNAMLCQQAYDGEDVNGNNLLDPGEDGNGNGRLDRYILPQPPKPPKVRVEVESQKVTVYWDKATSEYSVDPVSRTTDFEGYRIYRSNAGADFGDLQNFLLNLSLVGEFDLVDAIGYDTGLEAAALSAPKYFPGDTVAYWYRFPPDGADMTHLNGWQYIYGVAAFDRGDSSLGVTPLQSKTEIRRVVPGTPAADPGTRAVGVYPNPYYAGAVWDGVGERNRKIYFYNLPANCEVRIYTLAGDIVADFVHDASTYDGTNIEWFRRFAGAGVPAQFAGGEHAWDLISKFDQAIATGLYLFTVKDTRSGDTSTGKFLVIK